jgi:hypothetical protein
LDLPDSISLAYGLAIESKSRAELPGWLQAAVEQSYANLQTWNRRNVQHPVHLAVVVLHQNGTPFDDDLVVLRLRDFQLQVLPQLRLPPEAV